MPHVLTMPPASRLFGRLARFECSCPHCGALISTHRDTRALPTRMQDVSQQRAAAKASPRNFRVWKLVWNPHTQRLRCPHCERGFTVGLVLFPVKRGGRRILDAPPDTVPTAHERAELERLAGAWLSERYYAAGDHVNLAIDTPCSCPPKGWLVTCGVHGDPAAGGRG